MTKRYNKLKPKFDLPFEAKFTNSQMIKQKYRDYLNSLNCELRDIYLNPSKSKYNALKYCKSIAKELNSYNWRIISYNTFMFTVGFTAVVNGYVLFFYVTKERILYTIVNVPF